MDPFTQRMLERARARQEKIDQKLASSGQNVPKRKPLSENVPILKSDNSPVRSPSKLSKESVSSPRRSTRSSFKTESPISSPLRKSSRTNEVALSSPSKPRNDVTVTKKEFNSPRRSSNRNSDVSVEINIMHRNDIQIEVQVQEREAPLSVVYDSTSDSSSGVIVKEIEEDTPRAIQDNMSELGSQKAGLRHNVKSRLDRLGNLYSEKPNLSSPIHKTESNFYAETPPEKKELKVQPQVRECKKKFGRLAALADQINNWEDDLTHHTFQQEPAKKITAKHERNKELESSTLDVSIHSYNDINKVLQTATPVKASQTTKSTTTKPSQLKSLLDKKTVADLEGAGYRRVSATQSRLVYDFTTTKTTDPVRQEPKCASTTPSATAALKMATMVASSPPPPVTKKPSIKKYKAPTPPRKVSTDDNCDSEKDKENNVVPQEENANDATETCIQTKQEPADDSADKGSPVIKRLAPKLNGNVDRSSVLSKAAMFEAGSPRAKEKDPAEMSLRERKALFEKNKGAAIIPKAPFGQAPSAKTLLGDNKADKVARPIVQPVVQQNRTPTKSNSSTNSSTNSRTNSKETVSDDNVSQSSVGGGIRGKLAALFNKEQTISESTITNKFKQEREKEMEMLQNRFHYKPSQHEHKNDDSDEDPTEYPSEMAPLMASASSLSNIYKKPEIVANMPKVTFDDKSKSISNLDIGRDVKKQEENIVGAQPIKRRSSQDSPMVLSVLDDVKRIKVNNKKEPQTNGAVVQQPTSLYPHLSDIETDTSHTQEEYSDCGGSSEENVNDKLNKSDNWAETSFGREIMNVVKKNNSSYQKAVRESFTDSESQSGCDSELDDMLDEALQAENEGPTPPKLNKQSSMSSNSFVYKNEMRSPQKTPCSRLDRDKGNQLVHSVSFYRRMQSASSTPSTPIRVIKHSSPEHHGNEDTIEASVTTVREKIKELQSEISKQQTVISQASQALNLCAATVEFSGSREQAEGERLLLLATHRRAAALHELQRLQVEGAGPAATPGMASLHITGLTVPLRRDYIRQLNAEGAVGHHCVCLLKCRERVVASAMRPTEPSCLQLHFPDNIRMEHLTSDFKVTVEVYLLQASKEILPHEVKYHISNKKVGSKLLTPKSKCQQLKAPHVASPGGPAAVRSPQFAQHGYCIFALQQATRKSFTLNKVPAGSPLEGSITLEMKARVIVPAPPPHEAFLTAFDDVSGLGAWHRRWCRLQPPRLTYWKYPDDVNKKLPIGDIDLTSVISDRIIKAPRDLCARPNTLLLETSVPPGLVVPDSGSLVYHRTAAGDVVRRHLLAADTPQDRDVWLDCLNKALEYVRCCSADEI